jgi:BASS family bile acid:Na+ symporter
MHRTLQLLTNLFPIWVMAGCLAALVHPPLFTWFKGPAIVWGLGVIMLGMGLTLSVDDFRQVFREPQKILAGFVAQYLLMPLAGWFSAWLYQLDTAWAVGLILVACCPGGTASNVVTYLARANVALSVLMTMCSTFGAIIMTPLLTWWLAGSRVEVDAWSLFVGTVQVVLAPIVVGMLVNRFFPRVVEKTLPFAPLASVLTIALICSSIIGQQADDIRTSGGILLAAVFTLHSLGFASGYLFAWLLGYNVHDCRTISIEVGMQNSGLGVVLAQKSFPTMPATATPCAVSSVFHSVIGSVLAGIWRLRPPVEATPAPPETAELAN